MAKTGYPTAVVVANTAHKYMTRNQARLNLTVTPDQATALSELIICLAQFLIKWPKPPVNP